MTRRQINVIIAMRGQLERWLTQHENNVQLMPSLVALKSGLDRLREEHSLDMGGRPNARQEPDEMLAFTDEFLDIETIDKTMREAIAALIMVRTRVNSLIKQMEKYNYG